MTGRRIGVGRPEPLGCTVEAGGVNVAVFSAHATAVYLCLFDGEGEREVERIALPERTGDVFHGFIGGVEPGMRYGLRADGPFDPVIGHRFNPAKLLVDPYATALDRPFVLHPSMFDRPPARPGGEVTRDDTDSAAAMPKAIVAAAGTDAPPVPLVRRSDVIYELHVRGFTMRHPQVPEALRGTLAGLSSPAVIDHLVRLGVGAVELMPVAAWIDEPHLVRLGLSNYWGYNPVALMVPDLRLAPGGMAEVRAAVAAIRAAGIAVYLDVVLNHTGEGDELGPTLSLRGLDGATYFRHAAGDPRHLVDDTGTGNTLALDRPPVVRLAMDALRHWAVEAGVDGFRFDLGATLGRRDGGFDPAAPLYQAIAQDPVLRRLTIVAEPWDIGWGGYQLGNLPAGWGEWNDRYRDAVRRFWRGDAGLAGELVTRLAGSSDVFAARRLRPSSSLNFVAAHDGFTLADLVAYANKHNEANGEGNRDGHGDNHSWNHGVEGPADAATEAARRQDVRNLLLTLLASRGRPMIAMGDELGRSQHGNNNAYCQDNDTAWLDWAAADAGQAAFVARLVALRAEHRALAEDRFLTGRAVDGSGIADAVWLGAGGRPLAGDDWGRTRLVAAVLYAGETEDLPGDRVAVVLNAGEADAEVALPPVRAGWRWVVAADTGAPDAAPWPVEDGVAVAARRAMIVVEEATEAAAPRRRDGVDTATLDRLASAAGIALDWWDIEGSLHVVVPETKQAILAGMGLPAATAAEARDSLAMLAERRDRQALPPVRVVRVGEAASIELGADGPPPRRLLLRDRDGVETAVTVDPEAPRRTETAVDGRLVTRLGAALPLLAQGEYTLATEDGARCRLLVVPRRCHLPPGLAAGRRGIGLAAHLYSLRRADDGGIGDFGALAELMRFAGRTGAATVGVNPLHALFAEDRERASPYHPNDRRFLDPIYLDLAAVPDAAGAAPVGPQGPYVDYTATWAAKVAALEVAFAAFRARPADDPLVAERARFIAAGGEALRRFAVFQAITEVYPRQDWHGWPDGLATVESAAVAAFAAGHADRVGFHLHLQWLADRQLAAAAAAGRAAGVEAGIYRDLAVGCAPDGGEAWADRDGFVAGCSVGAPPDPFTADGQNWCLPPPSPHAMRTSGYAHLDGLLQANMRHAGALRIDHVMALTRLFLIPDGARAMEGAYVAYPLDDLLGLLALRSVEAECAVVGEDLGVVPEGLREKLGAHDLLSYRVLPFERDAVHYRPPESYPVKSVACASSHDLPPLAGWWAGRDLAIEREIGRAVDPAGAELARAADRERLATAFAAAGVGPIGPASTGAEVVDAAHAFLAETPSLLAMLQLDDLTGETEPLNVPGTDRERPNWRRRLSETVEEIEAGDAAARIGVVAARRGSGE